MHLLTTLFLSGSGVAGGVVMISSILFKVEIVDETSPNKVEIGVVAVIERTWVETTVVVVGRGGAVISVLVLVKVGITLVLFAALVVEETKTAGDKWVELSKTK